MNLNRARGLGRWQWCQCQHYVCALSPTLMSVTHQPPLPISPHRYERVHMVRQDDLCPFTCPGRSWLPFLSTRFVEVPPKELDILPINCRPNKPTSVTDSTVV